VKKTPQTIAILVFMLALFIASCGPASATTAPDSATTEEATLAQATEEAVEATATTKPTQGPTATVWPPVYDPNKLGDIRQLDSFIVTVNIKNTVNGDLTETTNTMGYIREPFSAYSLLDLGSDDTKTYVVGGRTYEENNSGDWYLSTDANNSLLFAADIPAGNTGGLLDAQFAGQEEFQGIPANHFILEKTDDPPNESNVKSDVEGNFYLAQDGNYVLYSHSKRTTTQGDFTQVYEVTQAMSSINQLTEITLPPDFLPMDVALDLPENLGLPLPPGTTLAGMIRYNSGGIGVDYYSYRTSVKNNDEFLEFYRNLTPTDGWTVVHIGKVSLHESDCEFSQDCVIIKKGNMQVVLTYKGSAVKAEFDWPHLFSPL
jgi:hypothetical protein